MNIEIEYEKPGANFSCIGLLYCVIEFSGKSSNLLAEILKQNNFKQNLGGIKF